MTELTDKEKILKKRAMEIAKPFFEKEHSGMSKPVLEFLLANERFALNSRYVTEVCLINKLTPLPCTPDFVMGIINLRGEILTVIDIKKFFSLPQKGLTNLDRVIVVEHNGIEVGILADEIYSERTIWLGELQKNVSNITQKNADFIEGISSDRLIVLDIKSLLSSDKIVVDEKVRG